MNETSRTERAEMARREIKAIVAEPDHSIDAAQHALDRLQRAIDDGEIAWTPMLAEAILDLGTAIQPGPDGKVGTKSAEAARLILRAIDRALEEA